MWQTGSTEEDGMRSERVDTAAVLRGERDDANGTDFRRRERERARIVDYYPPDLVERARRTNPPWRLLLDPTSWKDVDPDRVAGYFRNFFDVHARWPKLDDVRRKFNRVSNHRAPGEAEGQEVLL